MLLALFLVSFTFLPLMSSASTDKHLWKAAEGVYKYQPGNGYISMFVVTDEGVIAIEPVNTAHAKGLLDAIQSVTDKPVQYLLHSHNHWDHSKGGQVFRDAGATIIAHEDAYEWMKANPHPELALPDSHWEGKRKEIKLGDTTLELHHVGMSHGLGMTVFVLPDEKIAYIADLVTPNRVGFAILPDFNINEWVRALGEIEKMDFNKAIFSHSHAKSPIGNMKDVTKTREFIQDLQKAIVDEFKKGTSFMAIPTAVHLPKYSHWDMYEQWLPLNVWRVMLDMHMGPFPWHDESDENDEED